VFQESWLMVLGTSTVLAGALLAVLLWYLPYSRIAGPLPARHADRAHPGDRSSRPVGPMSGPTCVGLEGVALTDLRPAGLARFGDERVDVVTLGDFISTTGPRCASCASRATV
jgi:membrane-bound serine protease (ClpP class)